MSISRDLSTQKLPTPPAADGVFPTPNTDLAACLGALRVPIRQWRRIREADATQATTYHLFADGDATGEVKCATMEWAWRHPVEFRQKMPRHPLIPMRAAIESLRWIVGAYYGRIAWTPDALPAGEFFVTADWLLAACLRGCGHRVASFEGKAVRFALLSDDPQLAAIRAAFDTYEARETTVQWMRAALEIRATLIEKTKPGGGLRTEVRYTRGDPLNGGKEAFIYEDCPAEEKRQLLEIFHA